MKKIVLLILVVVLVVVVFKLLPIFFAYFLWFSPLQEKRQNEINYQNLCKEWNATGCNENPSDDLCKAGAGHIDTTIYPLNTTKCSDVSSEGIQILRQACCRK